MSHAFAGKGGSTIHELMPSTTRMVMSQIGIGGATYKGSGSMLTIASWPCPLSLLNCLMVLSISGSRGRSSKLLVRLIKNLIT